MNIDKINCMIVGVGQLGSRHLQALSLIKTPLNITVVDPSESSLNIARERFTSSSKANNDIHEIRFVTAIPVDIKSYEFCIVATNSNVRFNILQNLLSTLSINTIILEKLLFNKLSEYEKTENLIKNSSSKLYVNCPMRTVPLYREIKKYCEGMKIHYNVIGSNIRMNSNMIHHIDHSAFLINCLNYNVNLEQMLAEFIPSKREGFVDMNGEAIFHFQDGSTYIHTSLKDGKLPVTVEITSPKMRFYSRETENKAWISLESEGWNWKELQLNLPLQSQLTANYVEAILNKKPLELISLEDSLRLHTPFFKEFLNFCVTKKLIDKNSETLPFT